MANDVEIIPPDEPQRPAGTAGSNFYVNIANAHLRVGNIDAYRRLANDCGIDFAREVLASNERQDRRETSAMQIGMVAAGAIVIALIAAVTASVIYLGWWQSLAAAGLILCGALMIRVLLTGEWSDTSWFGKLISGGKAGKPKDDPEP